MARLSIGEPTLGDTVELTDEIGPAQTGVLNEVSLEALRARRARRHRVSTVAVLLDMAAIATAYSVACLAYLAWINVDLISRTLASIIPIYFLFGLALQCYPTRVLADAYRSAWRAGVALVWASLLMFLIFFFLKISEEFSRVVLGLGAILAIFLVGLARLSVARLVAGEFGSNPFAYLHLYDGVSLPEHVVEGAVSARECGVEPAPDSPAMLDRLGRLVLGLDGVVVHCMPERREKWAFMLKSLDVRAEIIFPELSEMRPLAINERDGEVSVVLGSGQLSWSQRLLKRGFDLIVTIALLPVIAPLLLVVAIIIKLDSRGPVFFRQDRIGLGNRKFKILKFRTMRMDMQDDRAEVSTSRNDPRVTRVGDFLRRTSLDELPQFINVLVGEMSIVGPRPHAELTTVGSTMLWEIDAAYWHRHVVKPGITGLAQVRGHRGSLFEEQHLRDRLDADLEYAANWSLANDLIIIFRTASVLIHRNAF